MGRVLLLYVFFFFFKQKTAYDMRISDWSSDVCSSDLSYTPGMEISGGSLGQSLAIGVGMALALRQKSNPAFVYVSTSDGELDEIGRASCRERVCQYV